MNAQVKKTRRASVKRLQKIRQFTLVGVGLILGNSYFNAINTKNVYQGSLKSGCVPFLNCHACPFAISSCPIGILQHFSAMKKIPFLLLGYLGIIGLIFGRAVCGWICPFGWVQEMMYKIKSRKFSIPKPFLQLKYVSLIILAIMLPYITGAHWFSKLCPWGTIIAGIPWALWNPVDPEFGDPAILPGDIGFYYWLKIGVLVFFLLLFVFYKRPFCRTFCPLGAIYSIFNRFSIMQLKVDRDERCENCSLCKSVCPVDIKISDDPASPECIRCLECKVCTKVRVTWGLTNGRKTETAVERAAGG